MNDAAATTAGVLLAAGRARRMGRLKQLLAWGDSTVVAAAFDGLVPYCGAGMVVVVGDDADQVLKALGDRPMHRVHGDSDAEQIHSALLGLRHAVGLPGVRHVLLHPADHPVVPSPVVERMLSRVQASDRAMIPTYGGRGGHPVLIPASVVEAIACCDAGETAGGLRGYWESHPEEVQRVEFPDAGELIMDLDTPDDYASMRP
ncbi:MAG: nucleotidyltransferase family protein [Phycisphaerales bacterium]